MKNFSHIDYIEVNGFSFTYYVDGVSTTQYVALNEVEALAKENSIFNLVLERLSGGKKMEVFDVQTERAICGREGKAYYSMSKEFDAMIEKMRKGAI